MTDLNVKQQMAAKPWYERGLGVRGKLEKVPALYHLLRLAPGQVGIKPYVSWLTEERARLAEQTNAAFQDCLDQLGPGDIALDLGANQGLFTQKLAATGATVHAFEPEPVLFAALQKRFADVPNVVLHQAAIAEQSGTVRFWLERYDGSNPLEATSCSIVEGHLYSSNGPAIDVDCIDFFAFLEELGQAPKVIKMDIEGAELPILERLFDEGAGAFDRFGTLFVETHERHFADLQARFVHLHRQAFRLGSGRVNLLWP